MKLRGIYESVRIEKRKRRKKKKKIEKISVFALLVGTNEESFLINPTQISSDWGVVIVDHEGS